MCGGGGGDSRKNVLYHSQWGGRERTLALAKSMPEENNNKMPLIKVTGKPCITILPVLLYYYNMEAGNGEKHPDNIFQRIWKYLSSGTFNLTEMQKKQDARLQQVSCQWMPEVKRKTSYCFISLKDYKYPVEYRILCRKGKTIWPPLRQQEDINAGSFDGP